MVNFVRRMCLHGDEENQHKIRTTLAEAEAFAPADSICPANDDDDDELNPDGVVMQDGSTKKRSRKLTEKGHCLRKSTLHNKRKKMNSRLLRQEGAIEDLMYKCTHTRIWWQYQKRLHGMITSLSNCCWCMKSTILYWTSQINVMIMNGLKKLMKECLHSSTRSIIG